MPDPWRYSLVDVSARKAIPHTGNRILQFGTSLLDMVMSQSVHPALSERTQYSICCGQLSLCSCLEVFIPLIGIIIRQSGPKPGYWLHARHTRYRLRDHSTRGCSRSTRECRKQTADHLNSLSISLSGWVQWVTSMLY